MYYVVVLFVYKGLTTRLDKFVFDLVIILKVCNS